MAIDEHRVGVNAAKFMEDLSAKYGEGATLGVAGLIAVIDRGDGTTTTEFRFSSPDGSGVSAHEIIGALTQVTDVARGLRRPDSAE